MKNEDIQQEISTIKNMIERAKMDTAASGTIFLFIGLVAIFFMFFVMVLERLQLHDWFLPSVIIMTVLSGFIGYFVMRKDKKNEKIQTYAKKINVSVLAVCSITMIMTGIIFPLTQVYSWHLSPVFSALLFGIMLFSSGVILDFKLLYLGAIVSWAGAILMAYVSTSHFPIHAITLIVILTTGFIIPGVILNRKYKSRSQTNES